MSALVRWAFTAALAFALPAAAQDQPRNDCGPRETLRVVKRGIAATLFSDGGAGTPESPRRYCLGWKGVLTTMDDPMLVFVTPSDGQHPEYPKAGVSLTGRAVTEPKQTPEDQYPYSVWAIPSLAPEMSWGMYAAVWEIDESQKVAKYVRPIMWWGLIRGQAFDAVPSLGVNAKLKRLNLPPQ